MRSTALLDTACALLSTSDLPVGTRAHVAAWFARAALEDATIVILRGHGLTSDPAKMTMASRLICLRSLDVESADDAGQAWWGLSRACHHHAYELTPSTAEILHLIDRVRALGERSNPVSQPTPDHEPAVKKVRSTT